MKPFEFIKANALFLENAVPKTVCDQILKFSYSENQILKLNRFDGILSYFTNIIPSKCDGQNFVKASEYELLTISSSTNKKLNGIFKKNYETTSYDENGNCSYCTIYLYLADFDPSFSRTEFYANPKRNLYFNHPTAVSYTTFSKAGNAVLYTHKVGVIEYGTKYALKIKLFYTCESPCESANKKNKNKKVLFIDNKIKYKVPDSNLLKFTNIKFGDIILSPDLKNTNTIKRWEEVVKAPKKLKILSFKVASHINSQMGRPPREDEDYCPNCFEILPLNVTYYNCSGCLSPIYY